MIKNIVSIFLLLFFTCQLYAQNRGGGIAWNQKDSERVICDSCRYFTIPLPPAVSLKKYCPKVADQGETNSCVGWSVGYGTYSMMEAIRNAWTDTKIITDSARSAMYLYNQLNIRDCDSKTSVVAALDTLKSQGVCRIADFSYDYCDKLPPKELIQKTREKERIKEYAMLFSLQNKNAFLKIQLVKECLEKGAPVIVSMNITDDFFYLPPGQKFWTPDTNEKTIGGHAMVVVGYNDTLQAFEVLSSWGDKWANGGFVWVQYDNFARYSKTAYQMFFHQKKAEPLVWETKMDFQYLKKFKSKDLSIYENMECRLKEVDYGKYYEVQRKKWKEQDTFRVWIQNPQDYQYIYAFALNTKQRIIPLYPFNKESPQVWRKKLCIPFSTKQIGMKEKGKYYVCLLFSKEKMNEQKFYYAFSKDTDEIKPLKIVKKVAADYLVPYENIQYDAKKIRFSTNSDTKEQNLVCVWIELEVKDIK